MSLAFTAEGGVSESVATEAVVSAFTVDYMAKINDPATTATTMTESKAKALVFVFISCYVTSQSSKKGEQ